MSEDKKNKIREALELFNKNRINLRCLDKHAQDVLYLAQLDGELRFLEGQDIRQDVMNLILCGELDKKFEEEWSADQIQEKLYLICYHAISDRAKRLIKLTNYTTGEEMEEPSCDPFQEAWEEEDSDRGRLIQFLKTDPRFKDDSELFELLRYVFSGYTMKEAGVITGISVCKRYHKMQELKEAARKYFMGKENDRGK